MSKLIKMWKNGWSVGSGPGVGFVVVLGFASSIVFALVTVFVSGLFGWEMNDVNGAVSAAVGITLFVVFGPLLVGWACDD